MSTNRSLIASLLLTAALVGCSSQRPLDRVRLEGKRHLDARQFDAAAADFNELVTRKPEDHQGRYDLGMALIGAGQPAEAVKQMLIALDVQPLNEKYADGVAQAMLAANQRDDLTAFLNKMALERGRVSDFTRLGTFSLRLGNVDEAKTALITAARLDRGVSLQPQLDLAEFYESVGDKANWVKRLRMAYFLNPTDQRVLDAIARAKEIAGPSFAIQPTEFEMTGGGK